MKKPKNLLQIYGYLSAINHYWYMWLQGAHILAPLSSKSGKTTFCWTPEMDLALHESAHGA